MDEKYQAPSTQPIADRTTSDSNNTNSQNGTKTLTPLERTYTLVNNWGLALIFIGGFVALIGAGLSLWASRINGTLQHQQKIEQADERRLQDQKTADALHDSGEAKQHAADLEKRNKELEHRTRQRKITDEQAKKAVQVLNNIHLLGNDPRYLATYKDNFPVFEVEIIVPNHDVECQWYALAFDQMFLKAKWKSRIIQQQFSPIPPIDVSLMTPTVDHLPARYIQSALIHAEIPLFQTCGYPTLKCAQLWIGTKREILD